MAIDGGESNSLNQYEAVGPDGSEEEYDYDNNGNLTDDGLYTYLYDCENRLNEVQNGGTVAEYTYDYQGRRVSKTVGSDI
ncbi:MAG: hypothetical protein JW860_04405, partial [Sedimentisphaerales bacterium]|nr:hypothetical protein [Sedimentisphaerales bacterium]